MYHAQPGVWDQRQPAVDNKYRVMADLTFLFSKGGVLRTKLDETFRNRIYPKLSE